MDKLEKVIKYWSKFLEWIKWKEWKEIGYKFIRMITIFFSCILKCVKRICRCFVICLKRILRWVIELIGWIIFPIAILSLIVTLCVAFGTYFETNCKLQEIMSNINTNISLEQERYLRKISDLQRNVFNNNAITFLVSFVLVFLGSIWLNNERKVEKINKKSEKLMEDAKKTKDQLELERNTFSLHSQILALHVISLNCSNAIFSNNTDAIGLIIKMYNMATILLTEFRKEPIRWGVKNVIFCNY